MLPNRPIERLAKALVADPSRSSATEIGGLYAAFDLSRAARTGRHRLRGLALRRRWPVRTSWTGPPQLWAARAARRGDLVQLERRRSDDLRVSDGSVSWARAAGSLEPTTRTSPTSCGSFIRRSSNGRGVANAPRSTGRPASTWIPPFRRGNRTRCELLNARQVEVGW